MRSSTDIRLGDQPRRRLWRLGRLRRPGDDLRDRSIGVIDGLRGATVHGWFIGRVAGEPSNRFELTIDGISLGAFEADQSRPDVLAAEGTLACGFSLDLHVLLDRIPERAVTLRDGEPRRLALRSTTGALVHEATLAASPAMRGHVDRLDAGGLSGWAVDELEPGRPVELEVLLDGHPWLALSTSHQRRDLAAKGIRGEAAGFRIEWPMGMLPENAQLDVRARLSGELLPRVTRAFDVTARTPVRTSLYLANHREGRILPATVLVPIHNAFDAVQACLDALVHHLPREVDVLLVDDASTDPAIGALLRQYAQRPRFRVSSNECNLGYTRSVNLGMSLCPGRDVVLLNSDTVVSERWLESLRYAAYAAPRVSTVTAMSDNAGAFSVPGIGEANPCPPHLDQEQWARTVRQAGPGRAIELPTGNGFCMYVRRQAIDELGMFDEARFPRGYGEENDFCMRAGRAGWKNLICDRAFVAHRRSQSFGGERAALVEAGRARVDEAFPEYGTLLRAFRGPELSYLRHRVARALASGEVPLPRILYAISTQTGGTPQTNLDLMRAMAGRYHCMLLRCDARSVYLHEMRDGELVELERWSLARPIEPIDHRSDEYDAIVLDLLYRHAISLLHIRHVAWHGLGLASVAKAIGVPVVYSLHDFYSLCPSLNLLDERLQHCAGRCTPGRGACQPGLWKPGQLPELKHAFVGRWRDMFDGFMDDCDQLVTTASSAKSLIADAFPRQAEKLSVIAHGRDFAELSACARQPGRGAPIRVLVPGNISPAKGALLLRKIIELDAQGRFEFHFLGNVCPELDGVGIRHGQYRREEFAAKVAAIAPHLGAVLSVWPETYCHTLTELWACGVPVMAVDVGAVGDRIRAMGGGWLLHRDPSPRGVMDALQTAVEDAAGYQQRLRAIQQWQAGEAIWNDTQDMAIQYRSLYAPLLGGARAASQRIGLLVKGVDSHPPTAHIRMLRPLAAAAKREGHELRTVDTGWLLAGGLERIDALIVQRDAVPATAMEPLLDAVRARGLPLGYEIDDLLWELPDDHGDHEIDFAQQGAILSAIRAADLVTTTTPALEKRLQRHSRQVRVVPNAPDPALWLAPLDPGRVRDILIAEGLCDDRPRILYMGSRSHAADLALVAPAVQAFLGANLDYDLIQVGGGLLLPGARSAKAPRQHSAYPDFVGWFRAVASKATFALAPLKASEFNAAKSDLKFMDYALAGVPAIFSDVAPYNGSLVDGRHGLLVGNDPGAWMRAMSRMAGDPQLRDRLREQALALAASRSRHETSGAWSAVLLELLAGNGADANTAAGSPA